MPPDSSLNWVPRLKRAPPKVQLHFSGSSFSWEDSYSPVLKATSSSHDLPERIPELSENRKDFRSPETEVAMPTAFQSPKARTSPMPKSGLKSGSPLKSSPLKRKGANPESANEIVIVEDDDTPPPPKKSSGRVTRSATGLVDTDKLCEFPHPVTSSSVSVSFQDYKSLEHDTFVNDIIIDFYLTYLFYTILNEEDRPTVHLFSTMFYKRLTSTPQKNSVLAVRERDSNLSSAAKRHMRVKGWTKTVDLFSKNLLVIPICEHSHWYLIVVVRPGLITIPLDNPEERVTKGEPFIIVLDSMGGTKNAAVSNIRQYLAQEWRTRKVELADGEELPEYQELPTFSSKEMRVLRPSKPEQNNYSDCGLFLLYYVEKIFSSSAQFYWPATLPDLSNWFSDEEVNRKRGDIAELIRQLTSAQWGKEKEINWPEINFAPKSSKRQSSRSTMEEDESEDYQWPGEGHVLGGSSEGLAASGFYGERSIPVSSSSSSRARKTVVDVGLQQLQSAKAQERDLNRENRKVRRNKGGYSSQQLVKETDESRSDLLDRLDKCKANVDSQWEIFKATSAPKDGIFKRFKIPKIVSDKDDPNVNKSHRARVVAVSEDDKRETTVDIQVTPTTKTKPNSILNSLEIKARADLHKIEEGEACETTEVDSSNKPSTPRKRINKALEAFKSTKAAQVDVKTTNSKTGEGGNPRVLNSGAIMIENVKNILQKMAEDNEDKDSSISDDLKILELNGSESDNDSKADSGSVVLVESRPQSPSPSDSPEILQTPSSVTLDVTIGSDVGTVADHDEDNFLTGFLEKVNESSNQRPGTINSSSKKSNNVGPSTSEPTELISEEPVHFLEKVASKLENVSSRMNRVRTNFAPSTSEPVKHLLELVPDEVVQEGRDNEKKVLGKVQQISDAESASSGLAINQNKQRRNKSDLIWADPEETTMEDMLGHDYKESKGCPVAHTIDYKMAPPTKFTKKYKVQSNKSSPNLKPSNTSSRKEKYGRRDHM